MALLKKKKKMFDFTTGRYCTEDIVKKKNNKINSGIGA